MSLPAATPVRRPPLLLLGAAILGLGVAALLVLRGVPLGEWLDRGIGLIRDGGPLLFFFAMAVLPALGAPLAAFNLVAGEAFGPRFTLPGVIALALVAIAVNLTLTYWLARRAFRPLLTRLVARYGYSIPRVTPGNALSISLVVRLTPGPPFFLQGYLLGLAEVPFRLYLIVSWLAVLPYTICFVVLGKAARQGHFGQIAAVVGGLVVLVVVVQVLRRRYAQRTS